MGGESNNQEDFVASVLSDPTITSEELQHIPPPTCSFPLNRDGGFYPADSQTDEDCKKVSSIEFASCSGQSTKRSGKLAKKKPYKKKPVEKKPQPNVYEREALSKGITKYIPAKDILNLTKEKLDHVLTEAKLTEKLVNIVWDIRRRWKNKVTAQNARRRKEKAISQLKDEIEKLKVNRDAARQELEHLAGIRSELEEKLVMLDEIILMSHFNRDPESFILELDPQMGELYPVRRRREEPEQEMPLDLSIKS